MRNRLRLSRKSFETLGKVVSPFFFGDRKKQAWTFISLLLGMLILVNVISVAQSFVARDFINALAKRNLGAFYNAAILYLIALACATVIAVFYRYTEERLALAWREWMTGNLLHRYLTSRNYYRLRWNKEIDNPDYQYKLRFFERVRNLFEMKFTPKEKLLWLGDLNVAPTDFDVANPKNKKNHVCFHTDVKKAFAEVMSWGFVDIFRKHLPDDGEYTFWDYRIKDALPRNIGWRIDHVIGTEIMAEASRKVWVERCLRAMERPSDHTAVIASFEV